MLPSVAAEVQHKKGKGKAPGTIVIDPSTMSLKAIIKCAHAQERIRLEQERKHKVCCSKLHAHTSNTGVTAAFASFRPDVTSSLPICRCNTISTVTIDQREAGIRRQYQRAMGLAWSKR